MSDRLVRVLVAASLALSIGWAGTLRSSAAQSPAGGALRYEPEPLPLTKPGETFRFSLCENRKLLATDVSAPCNRSNVFKGISGGHNANFVFNTGGTFLPRGLTLDGNGVLSGKTDVDLSQVPIHVCVIQLNEAAGCGNLQFGDPPAQVKATHRNPAALAAVLGGVVVGGVVLGKAAQDYANSQQSSGGSSGGSSNSCTTSQPSSCTSSSRCSCGYRCVTFDGTGGVGFCSP